MSRSAVPRASLWARRAERALWGAGAFLLVGSLGWKAFGAWSAKRDLDRFDRVAGAAVEAAEPVDMSLWSEARRKGYEESLSRDLGPTIAVLSIAKLRLTVPVLEGTGAITLDRGAGHIEGTAAPGSDGNVGIAGHRDGFFRPLKDVSKGDVVELRTSSGTSTYIVDELKIVDPGEISVLDATSRPTLTLVTCYPFYFVGSAPKRFVVRAVRQ